MSDDAGRNMAASPSRSDAEMMDDIRRCLADLPFDTSAVRVSVRNGAAEVEGTVESAEARAEVLDVIGGLSGALVTGERLRVRG